MSITSDEEHVKVYVQAMQLFMDSGLRQAIEAVSGSDTPVSADGPAMRIA
jgi:hypothetical protein